LYDVLYQHHTNAIETHCNASSCKNLYCVLLYNVENTKFVYSFKQEILWLFLYSIHHIFRLICYSISHYFCVYVWQKANACVECSHSFIATTYPLLH